MAAEGGVPVLESELIGLAPKCAFSGTTPQYLKLKDFDEHRLLKPISNIYLDRLTFFFGFLLLALAIALRSFLSIISPVGEGDEGGGTDVSFEVSEGFLFPAACADFPGNCLCRHLAELPDKSGNKNQRNPF